jgi:hypothetical protein
LPATVTDTASNAMPSSTSTAAMSRKD